MSDEPIYLDMPPPADRRIEELHLWMATHADGAEGIMSADMPLPHGLGTRHIPLISSKRELAESMRPPASQLQQEANRQGNGGITIRLVTFRRVKP